MGKNNELGHLIGKIEDIEANNQNKIRDHRVEHFCPKCGKFILTEQRMHFAGSIKCIAGSYNNGYYYAKEDIFYCKECANKFGLEVCTTTEKGIVRSRE